MNADPTSRFRDPDTVRRLASSIAALDPGHRVVLMHVCGTHENTLCQYGLRDLLPAWLRLIAGPGCPVCVCPAAEIDMAVRLALGRGVIVATFGDVMRVPAHLSLMEAKARGGDIRVVYGIDDAIEIASQMPDRQTVFFAVGFETTACTTAAALARDLPPNFSILCSHRVIPRALDALLAMPDLALDGFLLPGHVTTVAGIEDYVSLAETRGVPMAVAGFEPVDILLGMRNLCERVIHGRPGVSNAYSRAVRISGNTAARRLMAEVFEECDAPWRGIGVIPMTGFRIRDRLATRDAARRFAIAPNPAIPDTRPGCLCGSILVGRAEPEDCPLFRTACTPDDPVGPCMVAFEGTCQARFRVGRQ